jgi:hypothetical protein
MSVPRILVASSVLAAVLGAAAGAQAQGCVASRMNAPGGPSSSDGTSYYLPDGQ